MHSKQFVILIEINKVLEIKSFVSLWNDDTDHYSHLAKSINFDCNNFLHNRASSILTDMSINNCLFGTIFANQIMLRQDLDQETCEVFMHNIIRFCFDIPGISRSRIECRINHILILFWPDWNRHDSCRIFILSKSYLVFEYVLGLYITLLKIKNLP